MKNIKDVNGYDSVELENLRHRIKVNPGVPIYWCHSCECVAYHDLEDPNKCGNCQKPITILDIVECPICKTKIFGDKIIIKKPDILDELVSLGYFDSKKPVYLRSQVKKLVSDILERLEKIKEAL